MQLVLVAVARPTTSKRRSVGEMVRQLLGIAAKVRASRVGKEQLPVGWAILAIAGLSLVGWAVILLPLFLFWHSR